MFGMWGETEFDLRFELFGIPVRVHPIFWVSAAMLTWNGKEPRLMLVTIPCVFFAVLVHEIGHAVMSRRYGYPSRIVLEFLGGYATATRFSTWKNVRVSAAGPAAGLLLFLLSLAGLIGAAHWMPDRLVNSDTLQAMLSTLLFANLLWNIMNLIPVLPLDGGRITEALMNRYGGRNAAARTIQVGIASSGCVALWSAYCARTESLVFPVPEWVPYLHSLIIVDNTGSIWTLNTRYWLQPDPTFLMIFMGLLCASQVATYNQLRSFR